VVSNVISPERSIHKNKENVHLKVVRVKSWMCVCVCVCALGEWVKECKKGSGARRAAPLLTSVLLCRSDLCPPVRFLLCASPATGFQLANQ